LFFFVDIINDQNRQKYEKVHLDELTGVAVESIFIEIVDS